MNYYGIDIHKKYSVYTGVNEQGMVINQGRLANDREAFKKVIGDTPAKAVIEATGNWYYLHDLLEDLVDEVVVAHPLKTKAIASARVKTDKIDAATLAQLLRTDFIPRSYIPPLEVREQREILRYRASLVTMQTRAKNKIHAVLIKNGLEHPFTDLFGKKGRKWLESIELRPVYMMALRGYLRILDVLAGEIKLTKREIDTRAKADPRAVILKTHPGIGYYSALLILAEIGDIGRFPSPAHLISYAGLNPSVHSSGGITRYGRLSKQGSAYLRWIIIEVATVAARYSQRLGNFHRHIAYKHGGNTANIALGRKILTSIYYMLKRNEEYKESG
jgi:transposase